MKIDSGTAENMFESIAVDPFKLTASPPGGEILADATSSTGHTWLLTYAISEPETSAPKYSPQFYEMTGSGGVTLRYTLPEMALLTEIPTSFAFGADGTVWLALPQGIERYEPGGTTTLYRVPGYPYRIVSGPANALYFTQVLGNEVGRITLAGEVAEVPLPGANSIYEPAAGPYDLAVGPEGDVFVTEEDLGRIGRLTAGGVLSEFAVTPPAGLPSGIAFRPEPRFITAGTEGDMWFTDPGTNAVGRVTPAGEVTEYAIPPLPAGQGISTLYDVPNGIVPLAGGLVFSELNVKALGFVDPNGQPVPVTKAAAIALHPHATTSARNRSRCRRGGPRPAPRRAASHCGGRRARITASPRRAPGTARSRAGASR